MKKAVLLTTIAVSALFAWGGEDGGNTKTSHQELTESGYNLLMNQLSSVDRENSALMSVLNTIGSNMYDLRRGSIAPDFGEQRYSLNQDHFHNPWLQMNFSYQDYNELAVLDFINETAEHMARKHLGDAIYHWRVGNQSQAIYKLGCAIHYYEDMMHPHHASNAIGGTQELSTKHSGFETWQDANIGNYLIDSMAFTTDDIYFQSALTMPYIADFVRQESERRSRTAYAEYNRVFDPGNSATWAEATRASAASTQEALALLLYRFAHEIAKNETVTTAPMVFNVRVKTRDGYFWDTYGTDNTVRFGIEFTDGRWVEQTLDKSNYNDFEKGDNDWYSFVVNGVTGNMVRKVWLRKSRVTPEVHDDWYPVEFQLTSNDGLINKTQSVNRWIDGNWGMWYDWDRSVAEKFPTYSNYSPLHPVPGVIEAENYMINGYSDNTSGNSGGKYRSDNVDIAATKDGSHNFTVGWTAPGEWTEYLLDVIETGDYDIVLRTASMSDRSVSLAVDRTSVGSHSVLSTGDWHGYRSTRISNVALEKGRSTLRCTFDNGSVNLDRIYFVPSQSVSPLDPSNYSVVSVSSEETDYGDRSVEYLFDGNSGTIWHTQWYKASPVHPHSFVLDLGSVRPVAGFTYQPRQTGAINGTVKGYQFLISNDGTNWTPFAEGTFTYNARETKVVKELAQSARYVKFIATSEVNGNAWASGAEFRVLSTESGENQPLAYDAQETGIDKSVVAEIVVPSVRLHNNVLNVTSTGGEVELFTINGRRIVRASVAKGVQQVELSNLSAGLYITRLIDNSGVVTMDKISIK